MSSDKLANLITGLADAEIRELDVPRLTSRDQLRPARIFVTSEEVNKTWEEITRRREEILRLMSD